MSSERWQGEVWKRFSVFLSRRSESTVRSYLTALHDLIRFLGAEPGTDAAAAALVGLDERQAEEYTAELFRRPGQRGRASGRVRVADSTVKFRLARLRGLYRELLRSRLIGLNPFERLTEDVRAERGTKRPTESIDPADVQKLLSVGEVRTWKGRRNRCFFALLFGGGLRLQEALQLRICDVISPGRGPRVGPTIRVVKAKGTAVPALVVLPHWTREAVVSWREERLSHGAADGDPLLGHGTDRYNRQMSQKTAWRVFRRAAVAAGLTDKSPHSARASFATYLDSQNIPLADIALAMRHRDRRSTQTYIKRTFRLTKSAGIEATYRPVKKKSR